MKVLQKILSHGLLIAFIVVAFLVYTNRAELLPKWLGETETTQTAQSDQVKESAAEITPGQTADLTAAEVAPVPPVPVPVEPTASGAGETVSANEPETSAPEPEAVDRYRPLEPEKQSVDPGIEPADEPEEVATSTYRPLQDEEVNNAADPGAVEEADVAVSETPVEQTSGPVPQAEPEKPVAEQSTAPEISDVATLVSAEDEADDKSLQQLLEQARQLYWKQDVQAATAAYQALGSDYPRDANVWGEIGNFYFSTRQLQPASMAYYRAVSLLIDMGDTQKARQLLGVLYKLDANRGRELDARLQESDR